MPHRYFTTDIADGKARLHGDDAHHLAKVMRKELRRQGIHHMKVVYSKEPPIKLDQDTPGAERKGRGIAPGSTSFVPSVAGLIIAAEVAKDIAFER